MRQKFIEPVNRLVKKVHFSLGRERTILLVCMGISFLFWLFVKLSKPYQSTRSIVLEYQLPLGMQFREMPPATLVASLSGTGWELLTSYVFRRQPAVSFELPNRLRQEIQRQEIISKIEEKLAVKVVDLSQNYLSLQLDSTASKRLKIVLDGKINFSPDFSYRDSVQLSPDSVTVFGSAALLEGISHLKTESLNLKNLEQDVQRELAILNPQPGLLRLSVKKTSVFIPVEQYTEKSFTVPIILANLRDSIAIIPSTAEIKCVVGLSRYDQLDESDFVIEVNFENVVNLREQNTVPLILTRQPAWVRSVEYFPKAVEYLVIQ